MSESALHYEHKDMFKLSGGKFVFGSALHCLVLEPDEFDDRYVVEDFDGCKSGKNTKLYKEGRARWMPTVKGRQPISLSDLIQIRTMARNVKAIASRIMTNGEAEIGMFAEIDGVQVKAKADYLRLDIQAVFDVKTTKSIKSFPTSMVDFNYISQAALYSDIAREITGKPFDFYFILVENSSPYMVRIAKIGQTTLEIGRQIYGDMITILKQYKEENIVDAIKTVDAPKWFLDKYNGEISD